MHLEMEKNYVKCSKLEKSCDLWRVTHVLEMHCLTDCLSGVWPDIQYVTIGTLVKRGGGSKY